MTLLLTLNQPAATTTAPVVVGTVSYASVNGTNLPTLTTPTPPLVDGDLGVVMIGAQTTVGGQAADYTNDRSFTRVGVPFAAPTATTRYQGIFTMPFPVAASAPADVTFTRSGPGVRQIGAYFILRGVDPSTPIGAESAALDLVSGSTVTVGALTAPVDKTLAIATFSSTWASPNDHAVATPPAGWTLVASYVEPTSGSTAVSRNAIHIYSKVIDSAGTTGACAVTYVGTPAAASGQMVVFQPIPVAVPTANAAVVTGSVNVPTPTIVADGYTIDKWLAEFQFPAIAHRGAPDGTTRSEFSPDAYENALASGFKALEISAHRTSDGVWVLNHDATTNAQYTTNATIASTSWATLQTYTRRYGDTSERMMTLEEALDAYTDQVLLIENKTYNNNSEFLDLLDAAPTATDRIVVKGFFDATSYFTAAQARGYKTWAYYFGTSDASQMPTYLGVHQDWVGLSSGPSNTATDQTWFDYAIGQGKPIVGHIVRSTADWNAMRIQGANMGMVNNPATIQLGQVLATTTVSGAAVVPAPTIAIALSTTVVTGAAVIPTPTILTSPAAPAAPTIVSAEDGDVEATIVAPANGGSAITDYVWQSAPQVGDAPTLLYDFDQADGAPTGWVDIGSTGGILQVIDGKLTTSGTSELSHGAATVHGQTTTGDWEVVFDFDLHGGTVENGGGINLWISAPNGAGVGFFIGDYQTTTTQTIQWHVQDVNVGGGSWTNITNTGGHPPAGKMRLTHRDSDHYVALNVWDPVAGEWDDQNELGDPGWVATNTTEGTYLIIQMRSDLSVTGQKNWIDNIIINPYISPLDEPGFSSAPGTWTTITDGTSTSTTLNASGFTNGSTYYLRAAAVNAIGQGAYSPASEPFTVESTSSDGTATPSVVTATSSVGSPVVTAAANITTTVVTAAVAITAPAVVSAPTIAASPIVATVSVPTFGSGGSGAAFSDDFNRADDPDDWGPNWINSIAWTDQSSIVSNEGIVAWGNHMVWHEPCATNDQFSEITQINKGSRFGPMIRLPASSFVSGGGAPEFGNQGYRIDLQDWRHEVGLYRNGVEVAASDSLDFQYSEPTTVPPLTWRLEAEGAVVRVFVDELLLIEWTDPDPLVGSWIGVAGAGDNTNRYDNWSGGDTGSDPNVGQIVATASIAPTTVNTTTAIPTPTQTATATVTSAAVVAVAVLPAPTPTVSRVATVTTITATTVIPTPTMTASATLTTTAVVAAVAIAVPGAGTNVNVDPAVITATTSIDTATLTATGRPFGGQVPGTVEIPNPIVSISTSTAPSIVTAVASVDVPTVNVAASGAAAPGTVTISTQIEAPVIVGTATYAATVITANASLAVPTVSATSTITPAVAIAAVVMAVPALTSTATVPVTSVTAPVELPTPGVLTGSNAVIAATTVDTTASLATPTVRASVVIIASAVNALVIMPFIASTSATGTATPPAVTVSVEIPAASVVGGQGSTVAPVVVSAAAQLPTPTITTQVEVVAQAIDAPVSVQVTQHSASASIPAEILSLSALLDGSLPVSDTIPFPDEVLVTVGIGLPIILTGSLVEVDVVETYADVPTVSITHDNTVILLDPITVVAFTDTPIRVGPLNTGNYIGVGGEVEKQPVKIGLSIQGYYNTGTGKPTGQGGFTKI